MRFATPPVGSRANPKGTQLLKASPNNRYLTTALGEPVFINGDTAWSGIANLTKAEALQYLNDCQVRGFNAVIVNLIEHLYSASPPNNRAGVGPFSGAAFQTSTVDAYWLHVCWFIEQCAQRGLYVFPDAAYLGFGAAEGWQDELAAANSTQRQNYGAFIGSLLSRFENIVYHDFGDNGPTGTFDTHMSNIHTGLISTDTTHTLFGHHFFPDTSGHFQPKSYMTWDLVYKADVDGVTYTDVLDGYNANVGPVILGESGYELDVATTLNVRTQAWGAVLSGACGHFYGHRDIWGFGNGLFQGGTWQSALDDTGRVSMGYLGAFFRGAIGTAIPARRWWLLAPDQTSTFVTSARGSGTTFIAAALASDDSWGAFYVSNGSSAGAVDVDQTEFSAAFNWTWYNPRDGSTTGGANGVAKTGTGSFTAPNTNDWVWVGWVP